MGFCANLAHIYVIILHGYPFRFTQFKGNFFPKLLYLVILAFPENFQKPGRGVQ